MNSGPNWPLAAMRVIDLSTDIAGPYCTKMLVDAGATVIKVESPAGDPLRRWTASGTHIAPGQDSALFQHLNASKRSVVADIETAAGRQIVLDLAATADLVVESYAPGALARLGLTLEALQTRNPGLSLLSISPWGGTGPWAHRPATEFTLQAATGATDYRRPPGRLPVAAGGRIGEWIAGIFAAAGALCAWRAARITGAGQHLDLSIFESMFLTFVPFFDISGQWRDGPMPGGVEVPSIEPAKDGWVGFCTQTGQQWKDFCLLIGQHELGEEERLLMGWARAAELPRLQQAIHPWTSARTIDEIIELATALRIPAVPIGNGRNLPHMDHFVERTVFTTGPGGFLRPRPPYLFSDTSLQPFGPAPKLGEHTDEVLKEVRQASPLLTKEGARGRSGAQTAPAASTGTASALALAGVRVIDLTAMWAGPFAASYLADMGADVIKIESIQRPDGMRLATTVGRKPLWEWAHVFAGANTCKRDVTLNLTTEEGVTLLKRLMQTADVVMESFAVRVLEQFGITWDVVHALNPRAIMLRMPSFGLDGPWRDRTGWAMTMEQVSGMAWLTGYDDQPLVVRGVCDPVGGMNAVFALLLALGERERTGRGQLIEVPLVEGALNLAAEQVIEHSAYGTLLMRAGNRGPCAAPQGVYRCAETDQCIALAVATDAQWKALCTLVAPEWAGAPQFATVEGRRAAHDAIDARIDAWLSQHDRAAAVDQLIAAGVPAEAVINVHYAWRNPQLEHRRFFQVMQHPMTGATRYPGLPIAFSALDRHLHRSPPPTLGQHNDEILGGELGLSADELADLRARKIIGERPSFM